jgi:REP element-mobilizing transposase RayT
VTTKSRIWFPNTTYHITARGNRRNNIFRNKEDFTFYLTLLEEALEYYLSDYNIGAYCLMDNHVHLLINSKERHLKYYISRIHSIYTKYFNKKYNYVGHLFQDVYYSELIETDIQMIETSRYIHLNPVRANMVTKPGDLSGVAIIFY